MGCCAPKPLMACTLKTDGMEKIMLGMTDLKMVRSVCIK